MKKTLKALPILWLVLGIVFASGGYYGYQLMKTANSNAKRMTHQIEPRKTSQQRIREKTNDATFNEDQITPVTPEAFAQAQLNYEKITNQWGIGALYIPSAGIQTKILAGMNNQNLMVGVGTYSPNQQLGKGNYILLAHNLVQGGGALGNLPKTSVNQVFYATDFTSVFEYVARKNAVVHQSQGDLLDPPETENEALMTLIRCEGGLNTPNRAIVQGTFLKSYPADQADINVQRGLGLVEAHVKEETSDNQPKGSKESFIRANEQRKKSKTSQKHQSFYSPFQQVCILMFQFLSGTPIALATGYLVLLSLLLKLATLIND